ncbi:MAG: GNAT family N-acetyltransferase [Comamonadaceae bacterium]|jgi:regulator of nucleoside diphosphate kinase|nr:GNAT family N-acetyltransferase [Comamonadaceae bacterium]
MNKPFISLCPEITRPDAFKLMDWLKDEDVTRYLSDSRDVSRFIEQVIERVNLPILTHLFNQGGRFFMACDRHDVPVGFVRLVKTGPDCEMVLVIGNRDNWGRQLGASAIREAMKLAFFDMRADKLIAKIHPDNARSLKLFQRCGFQLASETPTLKTFAATLEQCQPLLRENAATDPATIYITAIDRIRLRSLISSEPGHADLAHEVERAVVVEPSQVARDVVTMNSRALLRLDDEALEVALVYPQDADGSAGKLSVCSPIGTAILGYREGDVIDWQVPDRTCRVQIDKLLYQPEAAGHFHL